MGHVGCTANKEGRTSAVDALFELKDPEAKYKRYGDHFAQPYLLQDVMDCAPRVRMRSATDRARDQLADLAVLNARLGHAETQEDAAEAAAVRQRVEYLKRRRRSWELVTAYVTQQDALCTLAAIEDAARKVDAALSEDAREQSGVGDLQRQLVGLQAEVDSASSRLQVTQARVDANLQRVGELKREAQRLEGSLGTSEGAEQMQQQQRRRWQPQAGGRPLQDAAQRGLQSSLDLEEGLKNHWFAIHFSSKLKCDMLVPVELFGEAWVLFRDNKGRAACVRDECAHRACPLSLGKVVEGEVQCAYHGWQFNGSGDCTVMPSTAFCRGVKVAALPIEEADGLVWVWPGWLAPGALPAGAAAPPEGYVVHAEIELEVPVEHGLLMENLLDLAHAPFTHTSTFAKGWPVPKVVQFQAARLLGGNWQPYPIHMQFGPPCMVMSTIGLAQPGKIMRGAKAEDCANHLHQLHVCLPARRGHSRLLYRMSMDFLGWTRFVPGIQRFWKSIAAQVMGEDLKLVVGQQERMEQGADTWHHPVSYDKLAVRYRRWRNSIAAGAGGGGQAGRAGEAGMPMSAGELFALEGDNESDAGVYLDLQQQPQQEQQ